MVSSEHRLDQIKIQFNSIYCGQSLSTVQAGLPAQCQILGLIRGNRVITAAENPTLIDQDLMIVVSFDLSLVPLLKVHLKKTKLSSWRTASGLSDNHSAST